MDNSFASFRTFSVFSGFLYSCIKSPWLSATCSSQRQWSPRWMVGLQPTEDCWQGLGWQAPQILASSADASQGTAGIVQRHSKKRQAWKKLIKGGTNHLKAWKQLCVVLSWYSSHGWTQNNILSTGFTDPGVQHLYKGKSEEPS